MATDRVTIFDTTLRDGEQAPGFSLRTSEKVQLAKQLDALGVDLIEAGFPIASEDDAEGVKQVAANIRRPVIAALARCRFKTVRSSVRNADRAMFSAHCHDDLGLAVANTHAAITAGVRQVECTINGIGERAGNASLEEIVMGFKVRQDRLPFTTGIDTQQLFPASQLLCSLTGQHVQPNKAIVGRNAFAHEAGIHQDGMLKDRRTYEIMSPSEVGVPSTTLVLGKHSGRHAVKHRCEALGVTLTRVELDQVYRRVISRCDEHKTFDDNDLQAVIQEVRLQPAR